MEIIRWIIIALVILIAIGFAASNNEQAVIIKFIFPFIKIQSTPLPVWVVMYLSFAAGILVWLIVSVGQVLSLKNSLRKQRKEYKKLDDELNRLRNVNIAAEPPGSTEMELES